MAAEDVRLATLRDVPRVADRRRADVVDPEADLDLVLEPEHAAILGLRVPARVVAPAVQEAEPPHQRRLRHLRPAERGGEVDPPARVRVDPGDARPLDLL